VIAVRNGKVFLDSLLSLVDVEQIVRIVVSVCDPSKDTPLADRKRMLLAGVKAMIDADVVIWSSAFLEQKPLDEENASGDLVTTCLIDEGWDDDQQQARAFEVLSDPEFNEKMHRPLVKAANENRYETFRLHDLVDQSTWVTLGEGWRKTGLAHFLLTVYPITSNVMSLIGFHRVHGKPDFSDRDKAIVHLIFKHVEWLHRHGTNESAGKRSSQLAPRQRQVLVYLLGGASKSDIAEKLSLSFHTVNDYTKAIYKHFDVNSKGELQAQFLVGRR